MKKAPEIKNQLLEALSEVVDERLSQLGFTRNKRALAYVRRTDGGVEHRIAINVYSNPRYQPGAEAHIYPSLQLIIPKITERAMTLVDGDRMLLAGAPDVILAQPIDFTAPKDQHQRWFVTGREQFVTACVSIRAFITRWVLPLLSEISTPADLVKLYETNDARILKQKHWHIFVAAAFQDLGQLDKARDVVRKHFGAPGLRKHYARLFVSLGVE